VNVTCVTWNRSRGPPSFLPGGWLLGSGVALFRGDWRAPLFFRALPAASALIRGAIPVFPGLTPSPFNWLEQQIG
jgi:hypothetical protein